MNHIPQFLDINIKALAKELGECGTGWEIDQYLEKCQIEDNSGESTKWRRLEWVFLDIQRQYGNANKILEFMQLFLNPVRFINKIEWFEERREKINWILSFNGLKFGDDGKFYMKDKARTLNEAVRQEQNFQGKMRQRDFHPEMLKFCKEEIEQEDYFHAVFEAAKGLAQRIREKSEIEEDLDNVKLVSKVFSEQRPRLVLNSLQTQTKHNEQKGFADLLRGCFRLIRHPAAHEPRIHWEQEENAADYLSLLSLLHRMLDDCERLPDQCESRP